MNIHIALILEVVTYALATLLIGTGIWWIRQRGQQFRETSDELSEAERAFEQQLLAQFAPHELHRTRVVTPPETTDPAVESGAEPSEAAEKGADKLDAGTSPAEACGIARPVGESPHAQADAPAPLMPTPQPARSCTDTERYAELAGILLKLRADARHEGWMQLPTGLRGEVYSWSQGRTRCLLMATAPRASDLLDIFRRYEAVAYIPEGETYPVVIQPLKDFALGNISFGGTQ